MNSTHNDIICRINPSSGVITYTNTYMGKIYGYTNDELIGKHFIQLVRKDYHQKLLKYYFEQIRTKSKSSYIEIPTISKSGTEIWIGQNINIIYEGGNHKEIVIVAKDLLEQKETEQIIFNINRFPEENPNPVLRFSSNGKVLMYNNKAGNGIIHFFDNHIPEKEIFLQNLKKIYLNSINDQIELKVDKKTFICNVVPIKSEKYINVYLSDITAIKRANKSVRISEEKYRSIIENMKLGLLEVDNDDRIIKVYYGFSMLTGYNEKDLIGKKAIETLLPKEFQHVMYAQNQEREKGHSGVYEVQIKHKNGSLVWVLISGSPFYDENDKMIGSIGIHLDISDSKKMEKDLRVAKNKAEDLVQIKELFMANMSHEIRTPMNGIIGMANLLNDTKLSEKQRKYTSAIQSSSNNLLTIINDILDFSKIKAGKFTLEIIDFNLVELISSAIDSNRFKAEENGINLNYRIDRGIQINLKGDPTRLNQVILNLLSNAVKFSLNGEVSLSIELVKETLAHQQLKFSVKDNGIGIEQDYLKNIYESFSQAEKSTARKYGGTGLGLPISRKIVELMGGKLKIESEINIGSNFYFTIDFAISNKKIENNGINKLTDLTEDFNSAKILLVEDNAINRLMAITLLERWNCDVDSAQDGLEALEKVKKNTYQLILMDMRMPNMGGVEATKIIRSELKITTPIIALTANAIKGDDKKCIEVGMNDYLSKPFESFQLNYKITKYINSKEGKDKVEQLGKINLETMDMDTSKLYNLEKLEAMNDQAFTDKMVNLFCTEIPLELNKIKKALDEKDYTFISGVAHKMKPSIDYICMPSLYEEVKAIEIWSKSDAVMIEETIKFVAQMEVVLKQLNAIK